MQHVVDERKLPIEEERSFERRLHESRSRLDHTLRRAPVEKLERPADKPGAIGGRQPSARGKQSLTRLRPAKTRRRRSSGASSRLPALPAQAPSAAVTPRPQMMRRDACGTHRVARPHLARTARP